MELIYTHRKTKTKIYSNKIPKKKGDYLYFLKLIPVDGSDERITHKIGTTNDILRRMKEHLKAYEYKFHIKILWTSPKYSKYTTLRIEDRMKKWWIEKGDWEYLANDRFIIPDDVKEVVITVRKDYIIMI